MSVGTTISEYVLIFRNTGWHKDLSAEEIQENAGFFIIRAASLAEAVEIAKGCPGLGFGQKVDVRAIVPEPDELSFARAKAASR